MMANQIGDRVNQVIQYGVSLGLFVLNNVQRVMTCYIVSYAPYGK